MKIYYGDFNIYVNCPLSEEEITTILNEIEDEKIIYFPFILKKKDLLHVRVIRTLGEAKIILENIHDTKIVQKLKSVIDKAETAKKFDL